MISFLQSFRAEGRWSMCLLTSTYHAGPLLHKTLQKRGCCVANTRRTRVRLLYESHVQYKKLCLVCMCRGMGAPTDLCEGLFARRSHRSAQPWRGWPWCQRVAGAARRRSPGAGLMRSPLLPSRARPAELCPARRRIELNLLLDSSPPSVKLCLPAY